MTGSNINGVLEVGTQTYRVYVCCGKNCGPKGSPQLLDFLEEEVRRLSLQDRVRVYPGACQTHCESGPTVVAACRLPSLPERQAAARSSVLRNSPRQRPNWA